MFFVKIKSPSLHLASYNDMPVIKQQVSLEYQNLFGSLLFLTVTKHGKDIIVRSRNTLFESSARYVV